MYTKLVVILLIFFLCVSTLYSSLQSLLPRLGIVTFTKSRFCKPIPGEEEWPAPSAWHFLNVSVGGRLVRPTPPGLVCQTSSSIYNKLLCEEVLTQWTNSTWHGDDPFTSSYNDATCLPDPHAQCSTDGYPAYVVVAASVSDVQEAVKFARKRGLRLIIKGTGHDFLGRSAARDSLSIYTGNLRGIEFRDGFQPVMKVFAGTRMFEYYAAAVQHNATVVAGEDMNVGIGGWLTNGGHSPVSSKYGLGVDQTVEMEIVTANGTFLTVNEHSYPDLFWAMRGGGGSTFGVLISATMKVYPSFAGSTSVRTYKTTANSDTFWSLVAYFHSELATWNDRGAMGYYFINPEISQNQSQIKVYWTFFQQTADEADWLFADFEESISNGSQGWTDEITIDSYGFEFPNFSAYMTHVTPAQTGGMQRMGSWLLDRHALATTRQVLREVFQRTTPDPRYQILGHVVAGKGVENAETPGGTSAVHPAWRTAITHVILPRIWNHSDVTVEEIRSRLKTETNALRELAPESGAYMNEADPSDPDWQTHFFGSNYERLLKIKKEWDPDGVFWCKPCVGHELWVVESEFGNEGGIGQTPGRICREI